MLLYILCLLSICAIYEIGRITTARIFKMTPSQIIFGFGKKIYKKEINNIEYSIAIVPIIWRVIFNVKNKFMNIVFSFCGLLFTMLMTLIAGFTLSFFTNTGFTAFLEIEEPNGIIEKAGIQANDKIIKVNNTAVRTINDLKIMFNDKYNDIICKKTILTILRDNEELTFDVSARFDDGSYFDCENNKEKISSFFKTLDKEQLNNYVWLLAIVPKIQGTQYNLERSFLFSTRLFGVIFGGYFLNYVPQQDSAINEYDLSHYKDNPVENINFAFLIYYFLIIADCFFIFVNIFIPFPPAFTGNIIAWVISIFKSRKQTNNN